MDIYRILVNHAPVFADCRPEVEWHIPHDYTEEMSRKSHVVSCIILINICLNLAVYIVYVGFHWVLIAIIYV